MLINILKKKKVVLYMLNFLLFFFSLNTDIICYHIYIAPKMLFFVILTTVNFFRFPVIFNLMF